jgi:hypothetical protein
MSKVRDIKIDLVIGNQNPILERFKEMTKDLKIIKCDVYNEGGLEFIYYNKEREWIFYQDVENGEFWAHYSRYWEILKTEFGLGYKEIQTLTKFLVEEALKRKVVAPNSPFSFLTKKVEEALKREVAEPSCMHLNTRKRVEEALKREVAEPIATCTISSERVEEALKREVAEPRTPWITDIREVEEALKREVAMPSASNVRLFYQVEDALKRELL